MSISPTELSNPQSTGLDTCSIAQTVEILASAHREAVDAVLAASASIVAAVETVSARLQRGGHVHYVGAGSSGRLGVLDASEMPPTFGTPPSLVCAHIAGGEDALRQSVEGAEDDAGAGAAEMRGHVSAGDAVLAISASGGAPYVLGAVRAAREIGAWTVAVTSNPHAPLVHACDAAIVVQTGAEPLTGSTRLKAGTAQKVVLNTISTAVMVQLGKVYDNLMVDVVASNEKLRRRAVRIVCLLAQTDEAHARVLLDEAGGSVKTAVVMERLSVNAGAAAARLEQSGGSLRAALS